MFTIKFWIVTQINRLLFTFRSHFFCMPCLIYPSLQPYFKHIICVDLNRVRRENKFTDEFKREIAHFGVYTIECASIANAPNTIVFDINTCDFVVPENKVFIITNNSTRALWFHLKYGV